MSISTHKMLAAAGIENTAQIIDQDSTLSSNTRTFFDCSETAPVSVITDAVKGSTITDATPVVVADGEIDGVTVKLFGGPNIGVANFDDPGEQDYIIIACARSVDAGADVDDNGAICFYYGNADNGQMKVQPYYSAFVDDTDIFPLTRSGVATPFTDDYVFRTVGDDYMFAATKRGNNMEHYADGVFTGDVDVASHHSGYMSVKWLNQTGKDAFIRLGHSAYAYPTKCTQTLIDSNACEVVGETITSLFQDPISPNTDSIVNINQDYYGLVVHFFPNGLPSKAEIENGLKWMKTNWLAGNKVIYPGWMF